MKRLVAIALFLGAAGIAWQPSHITAAGAVPEHPTFTKDVLPILQKNCQSCHRPGEVAPFALLSYDDVRPRARSIKNAVTIKQMPPWFAEDGHAKLSNDR